MKKLALLLVLAACGPKGAPCETDATCGEREACNRKHCEEVECRTNAHCPLETSCNVEEYTCEPGCKTSDDCFIGDRCDVLAGQCISRTCTDTQLDCKLGQRCDLSTGECYDDPAPHCARCFDDAGCGENGMCARATANGASRCFLECSPEAFDPCPAGLQCTRTSEELFRCVGFCDGL